MSTKYSFLLPVYNRGHYLMDCVQSVLNQNHKDFELVIIDDGSVDNTQQVIKQLEKKDERIKAYRIRHVGLARALNEGIDRCNGEYILRQDSDDFSLPDRLEKVHTVLTKYPETDFLYHGMYKTFWEDGAQNRWYQRAEPLTREDLLKEQQASGQFVFRKDVGIRYRHSISEDWLFILDVFFQNKKWINLDLGLYEYILRDDSLSVGYRATGEYEEERKNIGRILEEEYKVKDFIYES